MMRMLVLIVIAGCIEPHLLSCPDDHLLCPIDEICDSVHHLCITPEQQHACDGLADHASCNRCNWKPRSFRTYWNNWCNRKPGT